MKDKQKEKYYERKAAGLCVICGKPAAEGKTRCFECGVKYGHYHKYYKKKKSQTSITEHVRNFRQKRKDAGLCVYCGRPKGPAEMTKLGCRECLDIRSEQQKQAYRKEATRFKERQRERYRKIYYERKAAGLCVRCGKPAEKGTLCKECKKKRKEVNMANYEKST